MISAESLIDFNKTMASEIFQNTQYPWEALPKISEFIKYLATKLPSDFEQIDEMIWVGKGTKIERTAMIKGPAIIGYDCDIRHSAFVRENVITGNNVVIGNSTEVKNALLCDQVEIPHFNYIGDSILGFKAHLGAGAILSNFKSTKDEILVLDIDGTKIKTGLTKFGAILGDRTEIGCNSVLFPGCIIGRDSIIYPLSSVRGIIPEKRILKSDGELCILI
jgi:NDP-sugar pyrophosphorylase family protein